MTEFDLIDYFFKSIPHRRDDVCIGIGDDAACLSIKPGHQLVVTTDTLVAGSHFLTTWDAFDIAYKAVMVNISDIAAMAAEPAWLSLALTLPDADEAWLNRFSQGLSAAFSQYHLALIGGDMTRGPMTLTITLHGMIPEGKSVQRQGAQPGDKIYVTGPLGGAAQAVAFLDKQDIDKSHQTTLMNKLLRPQPRVDMQMILRTYATAAIDISDGLSSDLNHICEMSGVGACLKLDNIPLHPLVNQYQQDNAIAFALKGGDDYELCFSVAKANENRMLNALYDAGITCYLIGEIEAQKGLRGQKSCGQVSSIPIDGYRHF